MILGRGDLEGWLDSLANDETQTEYWDKIFTKMNEHSKLLRDFQWPAVEPGAEARHQVVLLKANAATYTSDELLLRGMQPMTKNRHCRCIDSVVHVGGDHFSMLEDEATFRWFEHGLDDLEGRPGQEG